MSIHRTTKQDDDLAPASRGAKPTPATRPVPVHDGAAAPAGRTPIEPPRSLEEAEERYTAARDAWTAAMRRANSGRPADLASLAITQEAYELGAAEFERWRSGARVAIPIEPQNRNAGIEAAIGQEMAWRRVHEHAEKPSGGVLSRLARRLTGRD